MPTQLLIPPVGWAMRALGLASLATLAVASSSSSPSSTLPLSSSPFVFDPTSQRPLSLRSGLLKTVENRWNNARDLALLEQAVEDHNAEIVATSPDAASTLVRRRLIALPLDDRFDPPPGVFSHGHVQTGDKMSLPKNFWAAIVTKGAEVPWLFEVSRVPGVTGPRAVPSASRGGGVGGGGGGEELDRVVGGAIDFRSPSNYVFLPGWMMRSLSLNPRDVVDVGLIETVPPGSAVKLRPHSSEFVGIANHQAVLETELKHYSALTGGSVVPFDYNGRRYYFDVVELRSAPRGERVAAIKVQDCDIAAEFVRARDKMKETKKKKNRGTGEED